MNVLNLDNEQLVVICDVINQKYEMDFSGYSIGSLRRRFSRIATILGVEDYYALKFAIVNEQIRGSELINELTVNVTEMFRDFEVYKVIRKVIIENLKSYPSFKIWNAGCSTGEEPYSMAIFLKEAGILNRATIYGTDLNSEVLESAKKGIFHGRDMRKNTENYLKSGGEGAFSSYYTSRYGNVKMSRELSEQMVFARHDLTSSPVFNEFELIMCRNVLIYFDQETQNRVFELFYRSLRPFGYLVLGNRESLLYSSWSEYFDEVDKKNRIYKKKGFK